MINNDILEYIRAQRQAGVADEMIRTNLHTGGWEDADITEALATASPQAPAPAEPVAAVNPNPFPSQTPAEVAAAPVEAPAQPEPVAEAQPTVVSQEAPTEPQVASQSSVDMSQFKPSAPAEFPLQAMTSGVSGGAPAGTPAGIGSTPANAVISTMPMEEAEPASGGALKKIIIGVMVVLLLAAGGAVAYALLGGFAAAEPTITDGSDVPAFPLSDDASDEPITTPADVPNDINDVLPASGATSTTASDTSATLPMASSTTATETPASSL